MSKRQLTSTGLAFSFKKLAVKLCSAFWNICLAYGEKSH